VNFALDTVELLQILVAVSEVVIAVSSNRGSCTKLQHITPFWSLLAGLKFLNKLNTRLSLALKKFSVPLSHHISDFY